ncbi:MAG: PD-(D/E)XK nuclease domain-containing protein [Bacteroides sp.]
MKVRSSENIYKFLDNYFIDNQKVVGFIRDDYLVFSLMGQFVETEVQNAQGRADCVVRTQDTIYLFEFRLWSTGTPADALAQIKEKGYAVPYLSSGKCIIIIGASFDEEKRNIGAWETEEIFATVEKD